MKRKLTYRLLLSMFCSLSIFLHAQETYKGAYKLTDTITGEAEYVFRERGKEQIFEGPFKFNYSKKFEDVFKSINYSGLFIDNKKEGQWVFSSKHLEKSNDLNISNYEISYKASGTEYNVKADFKNDKADGEWSVVEQTFENTTITDTLFSSRASFKNALMNNQIKAEAQNINWTGAFDDDGFADGNWTISHKLGDKIIEEVRVYENGIFKAHSFTIDGNEFEVKHTGLDTFKDSDEAHWEVLELSKAYFNIFELSDSNALSDLEVSQINFNETTKETNQFLERAVSAFAFYNDYRIWNNITNQQEVELGKFKVKKFPFTSDELQQISEIKKHQEEITQIINQFFKDPQVEIGKLSFKSLNRYYAIFEIYRKHSAEIKNLSSKITNPSLEYLDRSVFVKRLAPVFRFDNQIKYNFKDEDFSESYNFPEMPLKENFNLERANIFFKVIHDNLKTELKNATVVLNDLRKIEALTSLEEKLIEKRNGIQRLFNNQNEQEDYNTFHQNISKTVSFFAEQQLKTYASLSLDEKKQQIDNYLTCFDELINLYDFFGDLPAKMSSLEELYTRITFNPYLMVDMEEIVKERLYKGYSEIAMPYLVEKIQNELSCNTIAKNAENIKNLVNKMSQLREQDTSSKEKQLRRVKDAIEVLNILELEIN